MGTVDLKTPLELKTIALHARNAEYNPKVSWRLEQWVSLNDEPSTESNWWWLEQRFSAVIMRLRDPKTTALIFGSGKVALRCCLMLRWHDEMWWYLRN